MKSLKEAPSVATEFVEGHFVVQKSHCAFSSIPIDQAHEQNNRIVKGDKGAISLTENSCQLLCWMVCGPEILCLINEFKCSEELTKKRQSEGREILSWRRAMIFLSWTRDIVDSSIAETVKRIEEIGKTQFEAFVTERLEKRTASLFNPIKRNNLALFSSPPPSKAKSSDKIQIASLKSNCSLSARIYVSCQVCDGDLEAFFFYDNQSFPPALIQFGQLRSGTKSDLLQCLEKISPAIAEVPTVEALLLDGAAIVNLLKPGPSRTFQEYSQSVFLPYVKGQLRNDLVWDKYDTDSLKATARSKRGKRIRRRVKPDTKIPGNWAAFLRVDENKQELFLFLADQLGKVLRRAWTSDIYKGQVHSA